MNRREFMKCAALLVSGVGASQMVFSLSAEQRVYLAAAASYADRGIQFFSHEQRQLVVSLSEVIIPATDTPGAKEAGVSRFIELMVADWFNPQERTIFMDGLETLQRDTMAHHGMNFEDLAVDDQQALLEQLESAASDSPWYELGNVLRDFISDAPFICQLKELTVWGFFTSEVGAKQVLRYNPMPMSFDGDIPLKPEHSSWALSVTEF